MKKEYKSAKGKVMTKAEFTIEMQKEQLSEQECLIQKLKAENAELTEMYQQKAEAYNVISNAFFWKITKPFRWTLDALKRIPILRLIDKGLHCWKQNGIRYTCKKAWRYVKSGGKQASGLSSQLSKEELARVFYVLGEPVVILTTRHTLYIAKLLQASLKRLWISTTIITEEPEEYESKMYIVICPQIFYHMPERYIAFQMEQTISSRWLTPEYMDVLRNAYAVLDYSLINIQYFKKNTDMGSMFYYLPVDYLTGNRRAFEEPQYDVLFYGDVKNARRKAILEELGKYFKIRVVTEVFGEKLYDEISRARIVLNLHYYDNAMLETTRLYEALSIGTAVIVSERSVDKKEEERLEGIVDFTDVGNIKQLKDRIAFWLQNEGQRREKVEENNRRLEERVSAFDYYFYRFMLANNWLNFDHFYDLAGDFVQFRGDRVCLSLPEAVERREEFDADNHYGFEVFPGLRHIRGWTGCGLSYKFIMKKAQEQRLEQILVCEDDVFFPEDFEERFTACQEYLSKCGKWDIFQGLMADVGNVTVSRVDREGDQTFVHVDHMISMVLNLYKKHVYSYLVAWDESDTDVDTNTIDRSLEARDLNIVATAPFLVGHKEELDSTVWGFNNSQYSGMIAKSSEKLERLAREFEKGEVLKV